MLKPIEASYNLKLIGPMCRNVALCARHVQLLLIKLCWGRGRRCRRRHSANHEGGSQQKFSVVDYEYASRVAR